MTIHKNVRPGQIWRSNDPRRLRGVRVVAVAGYFSTDEPRAVVICENIVSGKQTRIRRDQFATGVRGWSLEKDVHERVQHDRDLQRLADDGNTVNV